MGASGFRCDQGVESGSGFPGGLNGRRITLDEGDLDDGDGAEARFVARKDAKTPSLTANIYDWFLYLYLYC